MEDNPFAPFAAAAVTGLALVVLAAAVFEAGRRLSRPRRNRRSG